MASKVQNPLPPSVTVTATWDHSAPWGPLALSGDTLLTVPTGAVRVLLAPSGSGRGMLLDTLESTEHPHHRELTSPRRQHAEVEKPCPPQSQESRGLQHPPPLPGSPGWSFPTGRDCAVLFFALPSPPENQSFDHPQGGLNATLPLRLGALGLLPHFLACHYPPLPAALRGSLPPPAPSLLPAFPSLLGFFSASQALLLSLLSRLFPLSATITHWRSRRDHGCLDPLQDVRMKIRGRGRREAPRTDLMMKAPLTSRSFRSLLNLLRRLIMNL